jgi:thiol-disulfide isomerase/thioredoxin
MRTLALFAAAVAFTSQLGCVGVPSAESPALGTTLKLSLPDEKGAAVPIPAAGARATVLDFWSPSCAPCARTVPALVALQRDIEEQGARLVLVAVLDDDETVDAARATLTTWGVNAPFVVDKGGKALKAAGPREVPGLVVLNDAGVVRWIAPDGVTQKDILAEVR